MVDALSCFQGFWVVAIQYQVPDGAERLAVYSAFVLLFTYTQN